MSSSNRAAAAVGILDLLLLTLCLFLYLRQDRTAPVITFGENTSSYLEGMDQEALMGGVIALDAKDGDVTDSLVIEKISDTAKGEVIVTYVALDHANNVAKASRMFRAEAGTDDSRTGTAKTGAGKGPENRTAGPGEEQEPAGEGPEEDKVTGEDENEGTGEAGQGEERSGEDENTQEPVNEPPVLTLNTEVLSVLAGAEGIDWNGCIDQLTDDTDLREALYANLTVEGEVDISVPGDYPVILYTTDTQGGQSEHRELTVRVE